jgi:hypothetical protein
MLKHWKMWWKHIENEENLINAPQKWQFFWKIVEACKKNHALH